MHCMWSAKKCLQWGSTPLFCEWVWSDVQGKGEARAPMDELLKQRISREINCENAKPPPPQKSRLSREISRENASRLRGLLVMLYLINNSNSPVVYQYHGRQHQTTASQNVATIAHLVLKIHWNTDKHNSCCPQLTCCIITPIISTGTSGKRVRSSVNSCIWPEACVGSITCAIIQSS